MRVILVRTILVAAATGPLLLLAMSLPAEEPAAKTSTEKSLAEEDRVRFFENEIKPVLRTHCWKCHGDEGKPKGGLRLTSRAGVLKGGETGPAVSIQKPHESLLLDAINYGSYEMPPTGKLPQKQIELLTRWVRLGIPWTSGDAPVEEPVARSSDGHGPPQVNAETKNFWSFRPVVRPAVPKVEHERGVDSNPRDKQRSPRVGSKPPDADSTRSVPATLKDWVANPIDAFVMAKLEAAGLTPAPPAERVVLLRRAYYDLIGLPPSPAEVQAFLADDSPDAYEKLIDRLLDSPHYGEHWARHWLDLVRYAETNSYERDGEKPNVWRYRDYVIRSFNDDKPYDQFIREQLAGDELPTATRDSLIATGYLRLGIWDDEPSDPEQAFYDDTDDILATTGQVFLGLTVNCARCHDHKLDPIPQRDYYRLLAFFSGMNRFGVRSFESIAVNSLRPIATPAEVQQQAAEIAAHKQRVEENDRQIVAIENLVRGDFIPVENEEFRDEAKRLAIVKMRVPKILSAEKFAEYEALVKERDRLRRFKPTALDMALCVTEIGPKPRETHVLVRGNPHVKGEKVEPGFLSVLSPPEPVFTTPPPGAKTSGRRLALAEWIASPKNPLTARVTANRLWHYHFGRGIVRSASNFGMQGTPPTHPELLDWLAAELVARGWRLKEMHKLIMLSNTYRMSSRANETALVKDPENDLFWRFDMRRLTAEEIRDSVLAVNRTLNLRKMFGPSIYPVIPPEVLAGQSQPGAGWRRSSPEDAARRSVYIHIKRSLLVPILESFDAADTDNSCPIRFATTQPTQALGMLNSEFLNEQARLFARSVRETASDDAAAQVKLSLERVLQRDPTPREIDRGVKLIASMQQDHKSSREEALAYFCLVALNLNEFVYLD